MSQFDINAPVLFGKYIGQPAVNALADTGYVTYLRSRGLSMKYQIVEGKGGWICDDSQKINPNKRVLNMGKKFKGHTLGDISLHPEGPDYLRWLANLKGDDGKPKFPSLARDIQQVLEQPVFDSETRQ